MPSKYEYTIGTRVHPDWTNRDKVPVPPQHIRDRLRLPARYALATLAPEVADTYPDEFYKSAWEYLTHWPQYLERGQGPMFVGPVGIGTSWTAAATANEIVMRSEGVKDVTASWLSCFWMLRLIQDHHDFKSRDTYQELRSNMLKNGLVIVDDLLAAKEIDGGVPFIHSVYAHRYDMGLPTITTISYTESNVWPEITKVFGRNFTERLRATTQGLVAFGRWSHE